MAIISGFRGIRYNPDRIDSFDSVLAPPYDVISHEERDLLYKKSDLNVIRLILSKGNDDEKYKIASNTFRTWIREKVLIRDELPSIYSYSQEFDEDGKRLTRTGFIATVKLEDFENNEIFPHEKTFSKSKADRLRLITASNANFSPVFSVYSDPTMEIEKEIEKYLPNTPLFQSIDKDGVLNQFWKLSDHKLLEWIIEKFKSKKLLIADGHHRYETALNYRNIKRQNTKKDTEDNPYDYVMMFLSCAEQQGLIVKPTYRLVGNIGNNKLRGLLDGIDKEYSSEKTNIDSFNKSLKSNEFGIITDKLNEFIKISNKKGEKNEEELGVIKLHNYLLDSLLNDNGVKVKYTKSPVEVLDGLRNKEYELGFILPNINAIDILKVVESNHILPQKTTYFYPKVLSGLVFNILD